MAIISGTPILAADVVNINAPGWTSYNVTWTSTGTTPAIGNGTLAGRYRQPINGDLVIAEVRLVGGSTTTWGTGVFFFSLPVAASSATVGGGAGFLLHFGVQDYSATIKMETTTTIRIMVGTGSMSGTGPFTWTTSDEMRAQVIYSPA